MHPRQEKRPAEQIINNTTISPSADGIEINFYTDPLCCWSWAMRPQWEKAQAALTLPAIVHYKMGGLLPSWSHYSDSLNAITKPIQMGPEWMHARVLSGAVIDDSIWISDPPASSFPACIAVKAAGLQGSRAEEQFLYLLQKAVMTNRQNIAKQEVLIHTAHELSELDQSFDSRQFEQDLLGNEARELFRRERMETKYLNINRFPTIILKRTGSAGIALTGYQTEVQLMHAFDRPLTAKS